MDAGTGPYRTRQRHRVHPVAGPRAGARFRRRRLSRAVALVRDRSRRLLAGGLGLLRHRGLGAADRGPRPPDHARRRVVSRGQAELRAARAAARAAGRGRAVLPVGEHAAGGPVLARPGEQRPRAGHQAARHGRPPRRPGRLLHAEHPADGHRHARHDEHRRGVDQLLPRLRRARGQRQVRAAVTQGPVLRGQLPVRRPGLRPQRRDGADHRGAARPGAGDSRARARRAGGPLDPGVGRTHGPPAGTRVGLRVRAGPVRPSAVGPVLLRNHRAAQGDHAQPRRHPDRAAEAADAQHGPASRRPAVLLHHQRLDDVELPGQLAAARGTAAPVRRQPGLPRSRRAVGDGAERGGDDVRREPRLRQHAVEGGRGARREIRPVRANLRHAGRLAGVGRGERLVLPERQGRPVAARGQRRHRRVQRVHRRRARDAGVRRRAPGAQPRRGRLRVQRPRRARHRPGRRDGHHPADAVDAGPAVERRRRRTVPADLLRRLPRRVAAGRFLPGQRARRLLRARPQRRHLEPVRHPHRHRGDLRRARLRPGGRGRAHRQPRPARRRFLHAAVRHAGRGRGPRRCPARHDRRPAPLRVHSPARARHDHRGARDPGHPDRQEDGGPGAQDPARGQAGRRRQPQRHGEPAGPGRLRRVRADPAQLPPGSGVSPGRRA